jgi:hypothetical protein
MEAATAQVRRAGAGERDVGLVAGHHRLDQRGAGRAALVADAENGGNNNAAAVCRAVAIAVIELDAVRCGAAEESGVEQVGAAGAAGHRDFPGGPHRGDDAFGTGGDGAGRAGDHHADGVEQVPLGVVPRLLRDRVVAQLAVERDQRLRRAGGGLQRVDGFGVGHGELPDWAREYYAFRIFSSTGNKYEMNFGGSSLIGKWPSPFMMTASAPVRFATSSVPSLVHE